jgi:cobalt/nickel transport protein
MKITRKLWIGLLILALLTPLGILVPHWFGAGGAWGEWSPEELQQRTGHVPGQLARQAGQWHAPLPDYGSGHAGLPAQNLWYVISAILGLALVAGLAFLLGRWLARNERTAAEMDN